MLHTNKMMYKNDIQNDQHLRDSLVDNGIKGIWNSDPINLKLTEEIVIEDDHLNESLYTLIYYINNIHGYDKNSN